MDQYFYYEARHYQARSKACSREATWALDMAMSEPAEPSYWLKLATSMQNKAAFEAKEARHYLMLAINPNHYKA